MDVRSSLDIASQAGGMRDDALVRKPPYQRRLGFIAPDRAIGDAAKRNRSPLDDAILVRIKQHGRSDHRKIPVPPRIFLE
jgi:hypothetical protein